jgi:hypothetical protein
VFDHNKPVPVRKAEIEACCSASFHSVSFRLVSFHHIKMCFRRGVAEMKRNKQSPFGRQGLAALEFAKADILPPEGLGGKMAGRETSVVSETPRNAVSSSVRASEA